MGILCSKKSFEGIAKTNTTNTCYLAYLNTIKFEGIAKTNTTNT